MAIREFGREIQNKISLEPKIFLKKDVPQVIQPQVQVEDPITEYFKDIFSTWKSRINQPTHSYFQKQPDITDKMRGILIDWLIDIHLKYKLQHETLFLAVNVLDRYLETKNILRDKLQLVGVTSMMIACKYEEIYPPNCKDFSQVTANTYTTQEIVMQEIDILNKLQFQITTTSVLKYLYKLIQDLKPIQEIVQIAHYFMDLSLLEINFQQYQPEQTANAALYLAS